MLQVSITNPGDTMSKTVLITGGAGFIAHHVIDRILNSTDWNIVSLDRLDYSGNLNRLHHMMMTHDADVRKRVKIIYHDLKCVDESVLINREEEQRFDYTLISHFFVKFTSVHSHVDSNDI